jgi:hypothetical protein
MPEEDVTLSGVSNVLVGTSIVNIVRKAGISTLTTTSANGLQTGATVLIQTSGGPFLPFVVTAGYLSDRLYLQRDGIAGYYLHWRLGSAGVAGVERRPAASTRCRTSLRYDFPDRHRPTRMAHGPPAP